MPFLFALPAALGVAAFVLIPAVLSLVASFFRIPLSGGAWVWVGFDNFERLFVDPTVTQAITNTLAYSVLTIIPSLTIGLGSALLVESTSRGKALVRTLLFLPFTANLVAMAVVFRWIFAFNGGFANQLLALFGVVPVDWLGDSSTSLMTVALVGVWRGASFAMMIFFAGLATIPPTINEAAKAEGIRGWAKLVRITLPMMRPTVVFAVVVTVIGSVQVFDTITVMTNGGPLGSSETILTMTWKLGFAYFDLGAAAALSLLLLIVLIAIGVVHRRALSGGVR